MTDAPRLDALLPAEIAERAAQMGVKKAGMRATPIFMLAVLAGGFVSMGGLFATIMTAGAAGMLPYGVIRLMYGLAFCLGLILIILAGAELFTGNTLITIAWASRKVTTRALLRNWVLVYSGNFVGAVISAVLVFISGEYTFGGGTVGTSMLTVAANKMHYDFVQALALGILCNALVCIAVWLTLGAHTTTDKIMAILFPITAFVVAGFEHSVANMYFVPIALLIKTFDPTFAATTAVDLSALTLSGFVNNLVPVTLGNIIGGVVMVGAMYWFIYLRPQPK